MPTPRETFVLTLTDAHPGDAEAGPVAVRLRRALKSLLLALHDLSVGLRGIIEKHAPDVLRMVLGGMISMRSTKRKRIVERLRDTMPAAEYERIVAEYRRP